MAIHSQFTGLELHEPYHFVQESDPGAVGSNLYWLKVSTGTLKRRNAGNSGWDSVGGGGGAFLDLSDVPASYSGQEGKLVAVNGAANALEFIDAPSGSSPDWVTSSPLTPPVSPNAMDDEFTNSNTLPGGGAAKWSWVNQGPSLVTIGGKKLQIATSFVNAQNVRGLMHTTALPSAPWEFTTRVTNNAPFSLDHQLAGMLLRNSSDGKIKTFSLGFSSSIKIRVENWNSATSDNGGAFALGSLSLLDVFLRFGDDNTNFYYQYSLDGVQWVQVFTETRNSFVTPNQIGLVHYFEHSSDTAKASWDFFRRTI